MASRRVALPALTPAPASAGVVDVITGVQPVVPPVPAGPLSEADARALTDRIRATAREIGDRLARLRALVDQARDGEAWAALGYASWTAYLSDTLEPMRLPRTERREVVGYLTGEGMSTRAIAPIVSADPKTVVNDRRAIEAAAGGESSTPASAVVTGLDGRRYDPAPRRPALVVVPEPATRPGDELGARGRAARYLERAHADRIVWWRHEPGTYHAAATLERARDMAAGDVAEHLLLESVDLAREYLAAYVLLRDRGRQALARSVDRERAGGVRNTAVG